MGIDQSWNDERSVKINSAYTDVPGADAGNVVAGNRHIRRFDLAAEDIDDSSASQQEIRRPFPARDS
jgi:hypothetical protein